MTKNPTSLRPETKKSLDNIMDVFGGCNGGIPFVHFLTQLRSVDNLAAKGDANAMKFIEIIHLLSRFMNVSNGKKADEMISDS